MADSGRWRGTTKPKGWNDLPCQLTVQVMLYGT